MSKKFLITENERQEILNLYQNLLNEQSNKSVTFTVKSDNGETIPGASVIIYNSEGKAIDGTSTNSEGQATITTTSQSSKFGVGFVGYKNYQQELSPTETNYNITLTSDELKTLDIQEQNDINLDVKDENGSPLPKVKIIYTGNDGKEIIGETDENGKFKKSGIKKNSEIKIFKRGYEIEFMDFNGGPIEYSFNLKPLNIFVYDKVTDQQINNVIADYNGEEIIINNDTFKNNDFKFPITITIKKEGYNPKTVQINGINSMKISLDKPEPPKPKEKSWRDKIIEDLLKTERLLTFRKKNNTEKYIQVKIENIIMTKDEGLDSCVVIGGFTNYQDKVAIILKCDEFAYFEILDYPNKLVTDTGVIDQKSLPLGKRFGEYANTEFYKLLKTNLKLCGLNKTQ